MDNRILVVEDNKTLANLIAKTIKESLDYEVDITYSLQETKLFLHKYDYFVTLLDINLPDAPNGEVVDYVLSKGQRAIILSATIDQSFRETMLKKNIIDYVNKGGIEDIKYIVESLQRLEKNKEHTILLVDDSMLVRKQMQSLLENMYYSVVAVAHGEEALAMLEINDKISLVLTDYNMPVMDGLELTKEIRKKYDKKRLPIIALSSDNDSSTLAMFLKKGANDYIKKPFSKEEFSCRINNMVESIEYINMLTTYDVSFDDL